MGYISLIPILPFIGGIIIGILYLFSTKGVKISEKTFGILAVIAPFISAVLAIKLFIHMLADNTPVTVTAFEWINVENFNINISFYVDTLSALMTLFITFIATLIHIYSVGYMQKDEGFGKFFSYLNLFVGSMLILVLADNPVLMFVGWEGVGACSYLLIAFYYKEEENVIAGNKAFIMNRVGDFAFIVGMMLLFWAIGYKGFDYPSLIANAGEIEIATISLITIFFFIGATGKSAQIPLYTWLPDAMAGPTPVSALIHAATMVTAGVYMVARFSFLYSQVENVGLAIAYIGAATALLAAVIALRQTDIKKILAYSTVSQLGYMFIAVGLGAYSTGIFHVFTHAFFKALLFLGAGAVIYALHHEQNIFKMQNLKVIRAVYIPMLLANLAIAGIPPFAGFFSKDEILLKAFESGHYILYGVALFTALLTAYYMFRLFFVTFHGSNKQHEHIHNPPFIMTSILAILTFGAVFAGFAGLPAVFGGSNFLANFLAPSLFYAPVTHEPVSHATEYILMALGTSFSLVGIFIAYKKFYHYKDKEEVKTHTIITIENKFYIDEIYDVVFVKSIHKISFVLHAILDKLIIANIVNISALGFKAASFAYAAIFQNGRIRLYAVFMLLTVSSMAIYLNQFIGG